MYYLQIDVFPVRMHSAVMGICSLKDISVAHRRRSEKARFLLPGGYSENLKCTASEGLLPAGNRYMPLRTILIPAVIDVTGIGLDT